MSKTSHWTCPYCNRIATLTGNNVSEGIHSFENNNKDGLLLIRTNVVVCPNSECREYHITAALFKAIFPLVSGGMERKPRPDGDPMVEWALRPRSLAKVFPDYIPQAIRDDYEEACLICKLSPKASATLARRCLQGIIRDFWKVQTKKGDLYSEIGAIKDKDKIDPETWDAIDAVRKVGNIGAHMEKDINVIVDVDPKEAVLLIGLIEMLLKDWYVAREERRERLAAIKCAAADKEKKRKSPAQKKEEPI